MTIPLCIAWEVLRAASPTSSFAFPTGRANLSRRAGHTSPAHLGTGGRTNMEFGARWNLKAPEERKQYLQLSRHMEREHVPSSMIQVFLFDNPTKSPSISPSKTTANRRRRLPSSSAPRKLCSATAFSGAPTNDTATTRTTTQWTHSWFGHAKDQNCKSRGAKVAAIECRHSAINPPKNVDLSHPSCRAFFAKLK